MLLNSATEGHPRCWRLLATFVCCSLPWAQETSAFLSLRGPSSFFSKHRHHETLHQQHQLYISNPRNLHTLEDPWEGRKYNVSILLIDHYDSFTYNLYDYFAQLLEEPPTVIAKDAYDQWNANDWKHIDGIVLSPGPGTPHAQPALSHQAVSQNPDLPILGVCLGHQLLALEYGARVDKAPIPIHGQDHWISQTPMVQTASNVTASESRKKDVPPTLFQDLPTSFRVVRYHSLAAYDLPDTLQVTARSKDDEVVQGLQHVTNPHYGVQFHPESIGTQHGMALVENFCRIVQKKKNDRRGFTPPPPSSTETITPGEDSAIQDSTGATPRFRVVVHPFKAPAKPENVFHALYAEQQSHSIWLDSSSFPNRGEIDILAAPQSSAADILEYHRLNGEGSNDILTQLEQELFTNPDGTRRPASQDLAIIQDLTMTSSLEFQHDLNVSSLPFHYRGGYLGYLGYEVRHDTNRYLHQVEGAAFTTTQTPLEDNTKTNQIPKAAFFLARQSLVYHHPTQIWYTVGLLEQDQKPDQLLDWMATTKSRILELQPSESSSSTTLEEQQILEGASLTFVPNRPKESYENDIAQCHEFIRQGESYELCLTNQLEAKLPNRNRSTWELYKILRRTNPAPYSAYLHWNMMEQDFDDNTRSSSLAICCSSPERFMSLQRHQPHPEVPLFLQAEAKPIKGTEARVMPQNGACRSEAETREDERRARSLQISLKNRAENLMIVDLLRNDMSRVCQVGSVHVAELMAIESFATVHQMVSTIRGTLQKDRTSVDLLRAAFPGGSMTGAPKMRTMELLEDLEGQVERGPYAGSLGYLSVNGCMDMNIIIRSAVVTPTADNDGLCIRVGAGGAITALSDTEDEYEEMLLKSRAVVNAVKAWASEQPQEETQKRKDDASKSQIQKTDSLR